MRPALRLLLAAAFVAPTTSNGDACAVILKEEGLDARACAALEERGLLPHRRLAATHAPHPHHAEHEEHHEAHTYEAGVYFGASLLIGALCLFLISRFYHAVPYTMAVFVIGLVLALVDHATDHGLGVYSRSMGRWRRMNPELLLCGFLPLLLVGDAMQINLHTFYTKMYQCLLLATAGVLISTFATAYFAALLPYEWSWFFRCMFGSIAAATDPVAVVALLNALGASPGLTMTITGESLFNDGTAMVLFLLFDSLAQKHKKYISGAGNPPYEVIEFFARMVLGGCFIGLAFGGAALLCLRLCQRKFDEVSTTLQITTTIIVAYASFYFSEIACGCSGVLATVMAALCVARYGWVYVDEAHTVHAVWEFLEYVGNTVVFMLAAVWKSKFYGALAGSLTGKIVCENWKDSGGKGDWLDVADFGWLLFTWFALVIIRCFTIAMLWPLLKWLEQRYSHAHQLEWKDGVVMAGGGLRGAVGLALALVVQEERAHTDEAKSAEQLLFLVSGIAMLTLLINGWSCKTLLDYLGMTVESSDTRHVRAYAKSAAAHAAAIALHDIVAKYGLDVHGAAQVEKSQLQRQATQRWNRVRAATRLGVVQEALAYDTGVYGGNVAEDDLDAADREAKSESNEQVLQRMRGMFLRALKAEFWEMIEKGLVPRGSFAAQILPFSCDVELQNVHTKLHHFEVVLRKSTESIPIYSQIEKCVELFVSWLEGLKQRGCLGDRVISSLSHWSTETERYYLITAFHAAYMRTSKHLDEVFAFFVQSSAFAVDARDSFKEEIDAQIKQCEDEAAKLPAHARARVDALLAAEVLVGVKHHIFEGFHRKGIITSKDRDELGEGLMQLEHHLENCREFAQAEFRRAARANQRHLSLRRGASRVADIEPMNIKQELTVIDQLQDSIMDRRAGVTAAAATAASPQAGRAGRAHMEHSDLSGRHLTH